MSIFKFWFCFECLVGFWWPLDNLRCFYSHQKTSRAQRPSLLLCMGKFSVLIYILSHSLSHESSICHSIQPESSNTSSLRLDPHGNSMTFDILCTVVYCEVSRALIQFLLFFYYYYFQPVVPVLSFLLCVRNRHAVCWFMLEDTQSYQELAQRCWFVSNQNITVCSPI